VKSVGLSSWVRRARFRAARILDLRRKGYKIETETLYFTTRLGRMGKYAVYRLKE